MSQCSLSMATLQWTIFPSPAASADGDFTLDPDYLAFPYRANANNTTPTTTAMYCTLPAAHWSPDPRHRQKEVPQLRPSSLITAVSPSYSTSEILSSPFDPFCTSAASSCPVTRILPCPAFN
ncbi:hypothetical protein CKAH01_09322 [Colletotrichum kahawae]|uniref:Uncharacterized protein n=1 Tax=Colletotrichum kahawae TaxID=34407 RepID=A0AAD9Y0L2_COLKA|nr:hypothetical protein CKAH01_09322 [Colletotrichum kahawae]